MRKVEIKEYDLHEELYIKPNLIVSNSKKAIAQAIRDHNFSFMEHQNHITVSKRWINTLFII